MVTREARERSGMLPLSSRWRPSFPTTCFSHLLKTCPPAYPVVCFSHQVAAAANSLKGTDGKPLLQASALAPGAVRGSSLSPCTLSSPLHSFSLLVQHLAPHENPPTPHKHHFFRRRSVRRSPAAPASSWPPLRAFSRSSSLSATAAGRSTGTRRPSTASVRWFWTRRICSCRAASRREIPPPRHLWCSRRSAGELRRVSLYF